MLIEVNRDIAPGQLIHGWSHGMYWRAIRLPVMEYGFSSMSTLQAAVYIHLLVPNSRHNVGLMRLCDVGELPALHGGDYSIPVLNRVRDYSFATGFMSTRLPWYDTYYGAVHIAADRELVTGYSILGAWYPGTSAELCFRISHDEFMQYLQPVAEHVCACVAATLTPVSAHPDLAIVTNSSGL